MLIRALQTKSNLLTGLFVCVIATMILIISISSLFGFYGYQYARLSVDKVRQFYIDQVDKTNTYNVNQIPIKDSKILEFINKKKVGMATLSPIEVTITTDNGNSSGGGYFGRTFTVKVQRSVKIPIIRHNYIVKSSSSAVNRGELNPDKDISYNIGDEFYDNVNGNGRT